MIFLEKLSQFINPIWYFNIKTGNKKPDTRFAPYAMTKK